MEAAVEVGVWRRSGKPTLMNSAHFLPEPPCSTCRKAGRVESRKQWMQATERCSVSAAEGRRRGGKQRRWGW